MNTLISNMSYDTLQYLWQNPGLSVVRDIWVQYSSKQYMYFILWPSEKFLKLLNYSCSPVVLTPLFLTRNRFPWVSLSVICYQLYRTPTILNYYSTNCNTIQIWSWCSQYLSSVGNRFPAIYVASYVLNGTTVPFEIKFTRPFLLQWFRLFCYQFVE